MGEPRNCPQCNAEIPVNSPAGLCPRCLLKASTDSQSAAAEPGPTKLTPPASGFVPPTVEELAPLFPQLEILELLGKGGMGAVYKARQPGLDRLVALKILPPETSRDPAFAERFQREARALARLSHPHIVAVYDFGVTGSARRGSPDAAAPTTEGLPSSREPQETFGQASGSVRDRPQRGLCYIVMEFVDGTNLRQTIRTGRLTPAEALAIVPQICEALQFAHDEGIVHRDIKPENILIDKRGRVKIADFGLAKLMANGGRESPGASLTATHQVMGTLRYMAPEQMQGSREVDHRADIYSLGVVFYELLTGELPMGKFAPPSKKVQVDVRLDEVVLRALEQDPEQRYQHASDVKTEVELIVSSPQAGRVDAPVASAVSSGIDTRLVSASLARTVSPQIVRQLKSPAIALMLFGLIALFPAALCFTNGVDIADGNEAIPASIGFGMIALSFLLLVLAGLVLHGGWHMLALENYRAALLASFLGQPIGLWGLFVLSRPDIKAAFASVSQMRAESLSHPKLVPMLATMNLVGAIVLMLVCAMEEPAEFAKPLPRLWQVWEQVDAVLGFSMAAGMFAASIGLFLWKPWARKVTLGVCIFGLASLVFDAPYLARSALPELYAEIQQTVIAEGVEPDRQDFVTLSTFVVLFGGLLVFILTWLIGQLVYLTRPRVIAAFASPNEKPSKFLDWLFTGTGAVVGVLSVFGPLALLLGLAGLFERGNSTSGSSLPVPPPRLGTITNGIGAEFTVPAGQVAVFEIVTRRDNETVPVPPHCGYVMAPPDAPTAGSLRWSRKLNDDPSSGGGRNWSLEILTAGGGRGYSEGTLVSEELNSAVGARGLSLGTLEPNEEVIHWGIHDVRDLPDNGLIGLRVTVVAHGMKSSGSGNAHIDWKKAQSATSTTRRKLTDENAP